MKNWRALLNSFHKVASKSSLAVKAALLARNQAECIIGYHLGEDAEIADNNNSEDWLIGQLAPYAKTFVDVGANRGDWTRLFVQRAKGARGLLFEPNTELAERLKSEFGNNPEIQIISEALSDNSGEATLFVGSGDSKTSSLCRAATLGEARACRIRTTTLDEASARFGFDSIDFLKIDAEGYDFHVLRGARNLLERTRIKVLQFEYGNAWPFSGSTLAAALKYLNGLRYQTLLLRRNGLFRFSYSKYREFFRYSSFVGIPMDDLGNFEGLVVGDV